MGRTICSWMSILLLLCKFSLDFASLHPTYILTVRQAAREDTYAGTCHAFLIPIEQFQKLALKDLHVIKINKDGPFLPKALDALRSHAPGNHQWYGNRNCGKPQLSSTLVDSTNTVVDDLVNAITSLPFFRRPNRGKEGRMQSQYFPSIINFAKQRGGACARGANRKEEEKCSSLLLVCGLAMPCYRSDAGPPPPPGMVSGQTDARACAHWFFTQALFREHQAITAN
eukprot:1070811-Pelagomonas_calceolata.AAC.3